MPAALAQIYRHPVKGLTPEPLVRAALRPGQGLPHDRRFALALPATVFDPAAPAWLPKTKFLMLMRDERLALLRTRFDEARGVLTIARDGTTVAEGDLATPAGRAAIEDFFAAFMAEEAQGRPRLLEAPGHMFSDNARKLVSIISLASIAALGSAIGRAVDPRRFRANFYLSGGAAWREFDWVDRVFRIGAVRFKGVKRIPRCAATNVDPETALRDLNIPLGLGHHFGHADMGIYAEVLDEGAVALGDLLTPPD